MISALDIHEHMEVVGADGKHIGRVDHVRGMRIELAKLDLETLGKHRQVPLSWVQFIDDKVHLCLDQADAERRWTTEH